MSLVDEFKDFISKGNVVDLAIAVVIGVAFNAVITALVTDIITPMIGIPGHVDFSALTYTINGSVFQIGLFVNAVINFIAITLVLFFFIVKPYSKLRASNQSKNKPKHADTKQCPECLSTIPKAARRCAFCTSRLK
jgi:large conductance mechanosensitive channel